MPSPSSVAVLLERERELAAIGALLDSARAGSGGLVVVAGEAGIGKTALLRDAAGRARDRGLAVLQATGSPLEASFPFGVARQLLEPVVDAQAFAGAAAAARPALGAGAGRRGGSAASQTAIEFELTHGLYWLVANLAQRSPLLIAVDDAQWADADSLRWLAYLAHRVEELPVAMLAGVREGEAQAPRELSALRALPCAGELVPCALSEAATARLARRELGEAAGRELCAACHRTSGGNPFLLRALLADLAEQAVAPAADAVDLVRVTTPRSVIRSVLARLDRLGADARAFARAVAIFGHDAALSHCAALAGVDDARAAVVADELMAARVLDATHPLRFAHPLLRAAVYADIGPSQRVASHRRAAELLDAVAPERAVAHLVAAGPAADEWARSRLRDGAGRAQSSGSSATAAMLLERVLETAPAGEQRAELLWELGALDHRRGRHDDARERLEAARAQTGDPALRARVARELALVHGGRGDVDAVRAVLERELREQPAGTKDALELAADRAAFVQMADPPRTAQALADAGRHLGRDIEDARGETSAERRLLATLAFHRLLWGQTTGAQVAELADRALAGGALLDELGPGHPCAIAALSTLQHTERDHDVEHHLEVALVAAREQGGVIDEVGARTLRARLSLWRGDVRAAESDARAAFELGERSGLPMPSRLALSTLVFAHVEQGELDAAEIALRRLEAAQGPLVPDGTRFLLLLARAALRRAQGRFGEAAADVVAAHDERSGPQGGALLGRGLLALALDGAGERERARRLAAESVAQAQVWEVPSTLGMALRIQGLVEPGERGLHLLRAATTTLAATPRRLEHARALVDLGAALRRANRRSEAREPLAAGMEAAHRCGAGALVARAHEELVACGARPRRPLRTGVDALTPSERRVAHLAAQGLTNREIAQALFVARKTVDSHLGAIYRKLDVNDRTRLGELLAGDGKSQVPPPDANRGGTRKAARP